MSSRILVRKFSCCVDFTKSRSISQNAFEVTSSCIPEPKVECQLVHLFIYYKLLFSSVFMLAVHHGVPRAPIYYRKFKFNITSSSETRNKKVFKNLSSICYKDNNTGEYLQVFKFQNLLSMTQSLLITFISAISY